MRRSEGRPAGGAAAAATDGAAVLADALTTLEGAIDTLSAVDPTILPEGCVTDALRRIARVDGRIDGVQARLVAAADARGVPERAGAVSTTSWVAQQTGRSHGQAARTSRIAKVSATTPELAEGLAAGRVGPDQAATIASGVDRGTLDADDATDLLDNATHLPPGPFLREARRKEGRRHQARLRASEKASHDARFLSLRRTEDGSWAFNGQVAQAVGDRFATAIRAFAAPDGAEVPDDQRRTPRQLRADALADILDVALSTGAAGDVGGVRPHVTVTVPVAAMATLEEAEAAGATGLTDCDTVLSSAAFRELACDATFRRLVVDPDGMPLDIGRATRVWPTSMRTAIAAADGGCRAPGCDLAPGRCIVHHVRFWEQGGTTSVANGVLLCNHGHNLVHVEGWTLTMDPATRVCTWTSPSGDVVTTHPTGPAVDDARTTAPDHPPDRPPDGRQPRGRPPDPDPPPTATPLHLDC